MTEYYWRLCVIYVGCTCTVVYVPLTYKERVQIMVYSIITSAFIGKIMYIYNVCVFTIQSCG